MTYEHILVTNEEGLMTITLNHPENLNPINPPLVQELLQAVGDAETDERVRVVVITGSGRAFSAGGDVKTMPERLAQPATYRRHQIVRMTSLVKRIREMEKPVIAMVNGPAVGAGCNLALACDIRIASENATFGEVFVRVGLMTDFGGAYLLPRLVGPAKACELIFTGDIIDSQEAYRIGLVNRLVPQDQLVETTMALARRLAKGPSEAIGLAKFAIYKGLETDLASLLEYEALGQSIISKTEDAMEGVSAFLEKRKPLFKGR